MASLKPAEPIDPDRHVRRAGDRRDHPTPAGDEVLDRAACPLAVVDVDVACRDPVRRSADEHQRHVCGRQARREGIIAVEADHDDPVDVSRGQVVADAVLVILRGRHEQDELEVVSRQHLADAAQESREERVREQPARGLGDHDADRSGPASGEAAGHPVRDIAEFRDRTFDALPDGRADPRGSVHHPRDRGPRDAGARRYFLQRAAAASIPRGAGCHRSRPPVRALSRSEQHYIRACQESALTTV